MRRQPDTEQAAIQRIRCAIYTRKSTEENLDSEFNSLDAQRESAEAYIASQRHEGWVALPAHYDDGGFSGGNLERPGLRRLLDDVEADRSGGEWLEMLAAATAAAARIRDAEARADAITWVVEAAGTEPVAFRRACEQTGLPRPQPR
jgi:hypothetical protein